ncbi:alpha-amylase family glycosyl hydrolase [uncultured Maribacter sp.]|uniref:alpha-amylase family glycosyl hydrolase n=1 Tax=uncultured Maribacter sp. TaxID=431308 RepID=UPI00261B5F1B|nr:alpha-amylase family glycosyl hydrolase [uncultured Maribacter sp.]
MKRIIAILVLSTFVCCKNSHSIIEDNTTNDIEINKISKPFYWEGANLYFLLTDRFNNGDTSNDINYNRTDKTGVLRGFEGGDLKGITQKIEEGYFTDLGVNAIWMSPIFEQIHGSTDEGTGISYAFHGYWTKDWTSLDANFGTKEDLRKLIKVAHDNGIRIVLDAIINHTGPVTAEDSVWPNEWVRTEPECTHDNYENTITCTLVENLPDIKTESNAPVDVPEQLVKKWKEEGRYEEEMAELNAFFKRTGYPRAPRFYIIKWLTDYIAEYGVDGYRVDTVKHTEEYVWQEFKKECDYTFAEWKKNNANEVLDNTSFYLVGEVYNYGISTGKIYDYGDKKVDYFDNAFSQLINFELKWNAQQQSKEEMFKKYSNLLNTDLKGYGTLNYMTSHDDGRPFDADRSKPNETATKLLLSPGAAQIYYGDETARPLVIEGAKGDATLRSFMNWEDVQNNKETQRILLHWQKLGKFRNNHPSVGAGKHQMISDKPYVFKRTFSKESYQDQVVIGLDLEKGEKELIVSSVFKNGDILREAYSNQVVEVKEGKIKINSNFDIVLLEKK